MEHLSTKDDHRFTRSNPSRVVLRLIPAPITWNVRLLVALNGAAHPLVRFVFIINFLSSAAVCGPIGGRPLDPNSLTRDTVYDAGVEKQGTAPSTRFYYDPGTGKCSPFTYMGAGGNFNNFLSRIDCELYCARCMFPFVCKTIIFSTM